MPTTDSNNDAANIHSHGHHRQSTANTTTFQVASYMFVFFFMMILHEVALEAASTSFQHLDSLASAVTLFQFGFCFLLPLVTSKGKVLSTFPKTLAATLPYVRLSMLVFGATGLATQSLKYVSYPTKVVFKSAKLIPTMIVSTFLHRTAATTTTKASGINTNKYGPLDYFAAMLLCLGAAGYSYNSSNATSNDGENRTSIYGITLLTISIICDALVPNLQQKLMTNNSPNHQHQYEQSSSLLPTTTPSSSSPPSSSSLPQLQLQPPTTTAKKYQLVPVSNDEEDKEFSKKDAGLSAQAVMVNTNAIGFGTILAFMLLSGSLFDTVATAMVDPMLLFYLVCVGVGLSTAVLAYTKLIKSTGSVVAVAVSTLRKVATVLLSYIIFPKPILQIHVFSGLLVFIGVLIATFCRKKNT